MSATGSSLRTCCGRCLRACSVDQFLGTIPTVHMGAKRETPVRYWGTEMQITEARVDAGAWAMAMSDGITPRKWETAGIGKGLYRRYARAVLSATLQDVAPEPKAQDHPLCERLIALTSGDCGAHCHGWCLLDDTYTCAESCTSAMRQQVDALVGAITFNTANYPDAAQPHILGQDTSRLRKILVDALLTRFDIREREQS